MIHIICMPKCRYFRNYADFLTLTSFFSIFLSDHIMYHIYHLCLFCTFFAMSAYPTFSFVYWIFVFITAYVRITESEKHCNQQIYRIWYTVLSQRFSSSCCLSRLLNRLGSLEAFSHETTHFVTREVHYKYNSSSNVSSPRNQRRTLSS